MNTNYCERAHLHTKLYIDSWHLKCTQKSSCGGRAIAFFALPIRLTLYTVFLIATAIERLVKGIVSLIACFVKKPSYFYHYCVVKNFTEFFLLPYNLISSCLREILISIREIFQNTSFLLNQELKMSSCSWVVCHLDKDSSLILIPTELKYITQKIVEILHDHQPVIHLDRKELLELFPIKHHQSCSKKPHSIDVPCIMNARYALIMNLQKYIQALPGADPKRKETIVQIFKDFWLI